MANSIIEPGLLDQSILFARFATAAYLDTTAAAMPGLEKFKNEMRLNEDNSANKTDTQALLGRWNNDVVIAFRGTESKLSDWWTDANGALVSNTGGVGRIHNGFKAAADSVHKHVVRFIKNVAVPESRLYLCGHSLGGALALVTACRLATDPSLPAIRGVFTYGSPRVGDAAYVDAYRATSIGTKTTMWIATGDPVARVAPHSFDYRHAVEKQFTLDQGSIGITELDSLMAFQAEEKHLAKFPIIQGAIGIFSRLTNAFQNLDAAEHRIEGSYLKQLLEAKKKA